MFDNLSEHYGYCLKHNGKHVEHVLFLREEYRQVQVTIVLDCVQKEKQFWNLKSGGYNTHEIEYIA